MRNKLTARNISNITIQHWRWWKQKITVCGGNSHSKRANDKRWQQHRPSYLLPSSTLHRRLPADVAATANTIDPTHRRPPSVPVPAFWTLRDPNSQYWLSFMVLHWSVLASLSQGRLMRR
jgi:hypothetical protein